ncbi:MAG TPA: malto-oligosyltrehalose trehalohydrolase, partial [Dokdonella sp.]
MSAPYARRYPVGAEPCGEGRTSFRVWAPSSRTAELVLDDGRSETMHAEPGGWFALETACATGRGYRFRFDGAAPVPDPASRAQRGGIDGDSVVVDAAAYAWRNPRWRARPWRDSVIYELHVGACGGYAGVRRLLPRLADLGVTTVELMPLAEFAGTRNWGYDGVLPFAACSAYGTPDELRALVDDAHGHGLAVMLDVVYNHFGPLGNHLGAYAKAFFRDAATPWGQAIDFRRDEVRAFFVANARCWIEEYRFDGLRFDAVHTIEPNDWLADLAHVLRRSVERPLHLVLENDANSARLLENGFDAQWNDDFHHAVHVLLTGETGSYYRDYAHDPARHLARTLAEGFAYQGEHSAHRDAPRGEPSAQLAPSAFVAFLQNHDQVGNRAFGERLSALAPPAALRVATALLLLSPQVPLLWMGQEWGSRRPFLRRRYRASGTSLAATGCTSSRLTTSGRRSGRSWRA